MGRAPISVALSATSPSAFSPHETVSLTIQLIYPEGLTQLFQHRRVHSHHNGYLPCSVFVAIDREASGLKFVTVRVCERQATGSLLKCSCQHGPNQGRCNERAKGRTHRRYTYLAELQLDPQYINCSKCFAMRIVPRFIMSTLQYPTDSCVAKLTLNGAHWADWDTCPLLPATSASKRSISGEERPT
jgi:hypothetical protein